MKAYQFVRALAVTAALGLGGAAAAELLQHRLEIAQNSVDEELPAEPETDQASKYFATFALLMILSFLIVWAIMTFR